MEYRFTEIEKKWQQYWASTKTFRALENNEKPGYYVLDMFPYPSGAGLHLGHLLGYTASDIVARYKRLKGFNVLHPMGFDSFGLPAEQYAIQTGQHPAITTARNIKRYREQLNRLGLSFDWDREVRTSDPAYYKWTQWIFIRLFHSWYNPVSNRAEPIDTLIRLFETEGWDGLLPGEWKNLDEKKRSDVLMNYRIAYLGEAYVNWCPVLGTVLANDEVKDGLSERGGFPVERKLMKQWSMRITSYAQRLLDGLEKIDWPESLKESQRYWIGRSEGVSLKFSAGLHEIEVFTTRPDTVFGVSFITLAPEHDLVEKITTPEYKKAVADYIAMTKGRSERERQAEVINISGQFIGAYATHPFTGKIIPIWIGDYVLAGYGTGAVMAVPGHDSRDYAFARHFDLPIIEVVRGGDLSRESYDAKEGKLIHSGFLDGLEVKDAIKKAIKEIEKRNMGKARISYRLRDAVFGRQRYWGEPIPVYYKNGVPHTVNEKDLPVVLPEIDTFLPTETGEPPLARASNWKYQDKYEYEHTTMPGWAGSSWYYLRYMDPSNAKEFAGKKALDYWQNIDLYLGGSEHATGHLLYVRFWTLFLHDLGYVDFDEPAKKLLNQGMIQGRSNFVYRLSGSDKKPVFVSKSVREALLKKDRVLTSIHVDVNLVENDVLNVAAFKKWRPEYANAEFVLDKEGRYLCGWEIEKMSKSKHNVVSPDEICEKYGADCLRLYEMFLGPLDQSKPWNTNGITGVSGFLKKLWKLFHDDQFNFTVSEEAPDKSELKALHKTLKKIQEDIERFSFNTSVSNFMICVNELSELKCRKRSILEPLCILISPYAPHIAEELWSLLGHKKSISFAECPAYNEEYLRDDSYAYPVSFNGKTRFKLELPLSMGIPEIEKEVLCSEEAKKYLDGKTPKKLIIVHKKIVNIVV